jgi:hypothetical protein
MAENGSRVRSIGAVSEGPGPRVCGLASARDRARLRERERAERARVERVLARGPREVEPRRASAGRCRVCGGPDVVVDEVSDGTSSRMSWRLVQCLRCDDRAVLSGAPVFQPRVRRSRPARREAANGRAGAIVREGVAG